MNPVHDHSSIDEAVLYTSSAFVYACKFLENTCVVFIWCVHMTIVCTGVHTPTKCRSASCWTPPVVYESTFYSLRLLRGHVIAACIYGAVESFCIRGWSTK